MMGEMSGNVLHDLSVMADEVIGPMLCNPENQKGWPKIVRSDMKKHVNDLRALMHQVSYCNVLQDFGFHVLFTRSLRTEPTAADGPTDDTAVTVSSELFHEV